MNALKTRRDRWTHMTTIAVLADPPREGLVFDRLVETSPLSPAGAADLYVAAFKDVLRAVDASGGELLVNYRPDDLLPDEFRTGTDPGTELRELAGTVLSDLEDVRFERQVGSTFAARAGNTATHLLESEDVRSVAVAEPNVPMLTRKEIDSAAMKLRSHETVLGPSEQGRVYYAGFTDPIDFSDAYAPPALATLSNRAVDAGHDVSFLPNLPTVETGDDLVTLLAEVEARRVAERVVPVHTAEAIDDLGLRIEIEDEEPSVAMD
jgi:glycosyltransferase A (GT-A) superfamily protein (DUF2064 family)